MGCPRLIIPLSLAALLFGPALPGRAQVTIGSGQTVELSGSAPYFNDGAITFAGGTLQAQSGGSVGNAINLNGTGTIDAAGQNLTFTGAIGGSGASLSLANSVQCNPPCGEFTFPNANNFSAPVYVGPALVDVGNSAAFGPNTIYLNGGTLQGAAPSLNIANNIVLSGGDALVNGTYSGSISGSGSLSMPVREANEGLATLTGNNTYSGGTSISQFDLAVGGPSPLGTGSASFSIAEIDIVQNGTTLANTFYLSETEIDLQGHSALISGPITTQFWFSVSDTVGGGVLTISGPITIDDSASVEVGDFAGYGAGAVTLEMGAADVMPAAGELDIYSGATFDMNGYAQTLGTVNNSGTVKTGAATLTSSQFFTTGTLEVLPFAGGPNVKTGMASVAGTLQIDPGAPSGHYTIIQAGTLTGTFSNIDLPYGYSDSGVSYNNNELTLNLMAPSFDPPGETPNEQAVAGALNAQNGTNADMTAILAQFTSLDPQQQAQALDAMSPIAYAALSGVAFSAADVQSEAVSRRMAGLQAAFTDAGGYQTCPQDQPLPEGGPYCKPNRDNARWTVYGSPLDRVGHLDGENGSAGFQPGYDFSAWGAIGGADYRVSDHLAAGLSAGYVTGSANIDNGGGSLEDDSLRVGAYATGLAGRWHGDVYVGGAFDSFTSDRNIDFGSINRTASASPSGQELDASADFGPDIKAPGGLLFYPSVLVGYNRLMVGGFSENGAGSLDLDVADQTAESLRHIIDAKLSRPMTAGWLLFSPYISAGWEHEYISQAHAIAAEFSTGEGSFAIETADVSRDGLLAGAGFTMGFTKNVALRADYSQDVRSDFEARTLDGNVSVKF